MQWAKTTLWTQRHVLLGLAAAACIAQRWMRERPSAFMYQSTVHLHTWLA